MFLYPILIAYCMDLLLGDPQSFRPHPVRLIGKLIKKSEKLLLTGDKKLNGILIVIIVAGITFMVSSLISMLAYKINIYLWFAVNSFLIYASISIKDLKIESMAVYQKLKENDVSGARKKLSMIVGRDTDNLSAAEVIRATVETIAESIVDGIISPLFYAFIGGAPLALTYKAVNTLDSMVGHKNEKYKEFGRASARLDDIANFIPARISGLLLPIAGFLAGKNFINSFRTVLRDGRKNPSPNSGIPESAVAGALQIQLGGLNFYNSVPVEKPAIGDGILPLEVKHIKEANKIAYICSALSVVMCAILWWTINCLTD